MRPHHRAVLGTEELGERVDVVDLPRVGLVRRLELVDAGIGVLEIDADKRGLAAEAETLPCRIGPHLFIELAGRLFRAFHRLPSHLRFAKDIALWRGARYAWPKDRCC